MDADYDRMERLARAYTTSLIIPILLIASSRESYLMILLTLVVNLIILLNVAA